MLTVLLIAFFFLFPVLTIYLSQRFTFIKKIGAVVICYIAGIILGSVITFPEGFKAYQDNISAGAILLAIPLLLFSLDVKSWMKMASKTFLSLVLGLVSVIICVFAGYFVLNDLIPDCWKIAGMLIGVYSGGTPNLAAIGLALDVDPDMLVLTNAYDLAVGVIVLLFMITVAQRFFLLFMRPYRPIDQDKLMSETEAYKEDIDSYRGIFSKENLPKMSTVFGLAVIIIGIGFALSLGINVTFKVKETEIAQMTVIILTITTLGIAASLIPRINRVKKSFPAGMYFILVFCLVFSSLVNVKSIILTEPLCLVEWWPNPFKLIKLIYCLIINFKMWPILLYIIIAVPGALLLHALLSKIFNVDVDNFMVISTGLSMSPPLVPVVAGALKNKEIIIPGLVVGIIGYAIGNYLGVLVAWILK